MWWKSVNLRISQARRRGDCWVRTLKEKTTVEADALGGVRFRYGRTRRSGVDSIVLACEDLFGRHF